MTYCGPCGKEISEGMKVCNNCWSTSSDSLVSVEKKESEELPAKEEWFQAWVQANAQYPRQRTAIDWALCVAFFRDPPEQGTHGAAFSTYLTDDQCARVLSSMNSLHRRSGISVMPEAARMQLVWRESERSANKKLESFVSNVLRTYRNGDATSDPSYIHDSKNVEIKRKVELFFSDLRELLFEDPTVKALMKEYRSDIEKNIEKYNEALKVIRDTLIGKYVVLDDHELQSIAHNFLDE